MDKQAIQDILNDRLKKISKLGHLIGQDFVAEDIHKFRVETKRLRSFLRLLATGRESKEIKLPAIYKKLYDISGAVREAQLEQKNITDAQLNLPAYSAHLNTEISKYKKKWGTAYKHNFLAKLEEKTEKLKTNELPAGTLLRFFMEHAFNIKLLGNGIPDDEDIHSIRKLVKDMYYCARLAEENWSEAFLLVKKLPLKELDKLCTALGAYNDARIMLGHFSSFTAATMYKEERDTLHKLCRKEKTRLQASHKDILAQIRKFTDLLPAIKPA